VFRLQLIFVVEKRVTGLKGFKSKTIMDDGAQRAFDFRKIRSLRVQNP
jgi:hypothetical protein